MNATAFTSRDGEPRIALVSFDSLGDSLIYLMMADNLQRNGFNVTHYGDIAYQMRDWLPQLDIRPYPSHATEGMETELDDYDLAIVSPPSFVRIRMDEDTTARLRKRWLLICQKSPESWWFDHTERLRHKLAPEKFQRLAGLCDGSGSIRFRPFETESVVEMTLSYMREKLHLETVTKMPAIKPPVGLLHRRYRQRIVISPDSSGPEKKNWRPGSFLTLCRQLKARDYHPVIVVAPKHHAAWAEMRSNDFSTPRFDTIGALCEYLYESGCVVANDSGNGHLASFLGIPVVTIYRKQNPYFHWRPDWGGGGNIVVSPFFAFPKSKASLWKYLISPMRVVAAIEQLLAGVPDDI